MKYLKNYKIFESDQFDWFKELFLELQDEGFRVSVKESTSQKMDFSKSDSFGSWNLETKNYTIKTIDVKIEKRVMTHNGPTLKEFNIDEIKETLRFAESYAKGELGLELEYIYVVKIPNYTYYKSVDVLPDNFKIDSITFAFKAI
jgi:hypothetical protein